MMSRLLPFLPQINEFFYDILPYSRDVVKVGINYSKKC